MHAGYCTIHKASHLNLSLSLSLSLSVSLSLSHSVSLSLSLSDEVSLEVFSLSLSLTAVFGNAALSEPTYIDEVFGGLLVSTITCTECQHVRDTHTHTHYPIQCFIQTFYQGGGGGGAQTRVLEVLRRGSINHQESWGGDFPLCPPPPNETTAIAC